ncbi:hypothetical protein F4775DRAFT_538837 [Biscogniauxia sp. FL1348]|nr:hypothetical protein F4775DRAFT_538837 [Biscogniauxia sp. FL1348]
MCIVQRLIQLFRKFKRRRPDPSQNPVPESNLEPSSAISNPPETTGPAISAGNSPRTSARNDRYEELPESTTEPRTAIQQPILDNTAQEPRPPTSLGTRSGDNRESSSHVHGIRPDPNYTMLHVYPCIPPGSYNFPTAFTATKCLQRTSYMSKDAAKRLGLGEVEGSTHNISWLSWDKWLRCSAFIVVPDDFMDTEVALGTEWSVGESMQNRIARIPNQPIQDGFPGRGNAHNWPSNLNQSLPSRSESQHDNSHNIIQPLPSSRGLGNAAHLNSLLPPRFTIVLNPPPILPNPYALLPDSYTDIMIRLMNPQPPLSQWSHTQDFLPQNHPLQHNRNSGMGVNPRAML